MTKYQISCKRSQNDNIECPILIPNENWGCGFSQKALIFLQERDNPNVNSKIIVYAVNGYFVDYKNKSQEVSDIKFTERTFLVGLPKKQIKKKLKACMHIEQIIELNDQYEIINPKINKNDYIQPENGILTLEQFLFNLEGLTFSKLRNAHIKATRKGLVGYISPFLRS